MIVLHASLSAVTSVLTSEYMPNAVNVLCYQSTTLKKDTRDTVTLSVHAPLASQAFQAQQ